MQRRGIAPSAGGFGAYFGPERRGLWGLFRPRAPGFLGLFRRRAPGEPCRGTFPHPPKNSVFPKRAHKPPVGPSHGVPAPRARVVDNRLAMVYGTGDDARAVRPHISGTMAYDGWGVGEPETAEEGRISVRS